MITEEDNFQFKLLLDKEEVRKVVFDLSKVTASGPNGFTGAFYQNCSDIIGDDIIRIVGSSFCGH